MRMKIKPIAYAICLALSPSAILAEELNQQSDKFANFLLSIKLEPRDRTLICLKKSF